MRLGGVPARTLVFFAFDSATRMCCDSLGVEDRPHVSCPQFELHEDTLSFGAETGGM